MQLRTGLFALGAVVAWVAACSSSSGFATTGGSFGSGSAGSTGPLPPSGRPFGGTCPASEPLQGESCDMPGAVCEIGEQPDPACNTIARCRGSRWTVEPPAHCPASCPARFDDRAPGESCSDPDMCTYVEATCGCAGAVVRADADAGDDAGDADLADAGTTDASVVGHWQCVRPSAGCPVRRPLPGTSCTQPMTCDYGSCVFGVPLTTSCNGNTWSDFIDAPFCP